jgi:60 kDa SS-A/Ro ribonucleoprotein
VIKKLNDQEAIRKARVHPIAVLTAMRTYAAGRGFRGGNEWNPVTRVVDALDDAFYLAFGNVKPTHKRILIGLDVSGSMSMGEVAGVPNLTPREASVAMCLVTAAREIEYEIMGFAHDFIPLPISPRQRLDDAVHSVSDLPFMRTDCALPMLYALENGREIDTFIVYTDSETWAGGVHPHEALEQYRRKTGIPAKLVVVGMVSNGFTIADPNDAGMMDVVGFDTATPNIISDFATGSL